MTQKDDLLAKFVNDKCNGRMNVSIKVSYMTTVMMQFDKKHLQKNSTQLNI